MRVTVTVNGERREYDVEPHATLAEMLRGRADCDDGTCGACTLFVDDDEIRSCLILSVQCHGSRVDEKVVSPPGSGMCDLRLQA
ncbi:2Fe-2S iron-sulfur cluster-binding protein [Actinoplanes sp. NPDC023714]|uniref:2Fe-2S iron-sulfur cluster-binding protein n=1 Tax=Actinoplanes sp. NPDC023714 TaxID=3154322 RepID=UPI003403C6D7